MFFKKIFLYVMILALVLPLVHVHRASANQGAPASQISVAAQAAILMDQTTGRVLYGKNIHTKMRIASITKVMTAILAIESGKLDQTVTISDNAFGTEGSSIYLKKGEKIKLRDLVYGLLLRSGNDAAVAIAETVGGSVEGFNLLMNKKARTLGMFDTHFANPHGLDNRKNHRSTAYDMALLTRYAMKNATFRKVFKTKFHSAPQDGEKWDRRWRNKNKLLFRYPDSTGGKTGYTKQAGRTLISTASKGDMDLVVVTLNDSNDWDDHIHLFNWGFNQFKLVTIVHKGKITGIKQTFYKGSLYAHRDLQVLLNEKEREDLSTSVTLYQPPNGKKEWKKPPTPAGMLYVKVDDKQIAKLPLFYDKPPKKHRGFWSLLVHMINGIIGHAPQ